MSERTQPVPGRRIYPDLAVAVLAGGRSRRFGADKAMARLTPAGPTLLEMTVATARSLSDLVAIIGYERYDRLNLDVPIFPDDAPGRGPLAGIASAMRHLDRPRLLVLACDMPCLSVPLLGWMAERQSEAEVSIPRTDDGRWQPMHAIYRRSALPVVERALDTRNGAVHSILPLLSVDTITETELRRLDPELHSLFSVNLPEDLERASVCIERN